MTTIFALSSGAPPAAIAIIRVSGPDAGLAVQRLAGPLPEPRHAVRRAFVGADGAPLDDGLLLWFPGPGSATGEDLAELHLHGGRAIVAAVEAALAAVPGLRRAEPGEFTRRAFANGRIDLAQAEGLADLLAAETQTQRRAALLLAGGWLSRRVEDWRQRLLDLSAQIEAALDFDEEDTVSEPGVAFTQALAALRAELDQALALPAAETLRDGFRIALAGPPNSGKSTLFNALLTEDAAITAPVAGTTRDVLIRNVAISGVALTLVDMAGLRDARDDRIEAIGVERAHDEIARADLVLWLGPEGEGPEGAWEIEPRCDLLQRPGRGNKRTSRHVVSALTGAGLSELIADLLDHARDAAPPENRPALAARQRNHLQAAMVALEGAAGANDLLLVAEELRIARAAFDALTGRSATEDMLDSLFARFCLGK